MADIVKNVDSFEGWEDGVVGNDRPEGSGIIQGILAKFTNQATWVTRDEEELSADLELVAVDVARVVQKWQEQKPVETRILAPHEKVPDVEQMNEETPREEWTKDQNGERGPWQAQHILYLLDLTTMDKYTYPTGTAGGRIAIRELHDKIMWMRRLRGSNVYAVVLLSNTFMRTRFGGRQRPHFKIVRWVRLGGEGGEVEALPPPPPQALDQFAKPPDKPAQQTTAEPELPLTTVKEPTIAEGMNDAIPDFGKEEAKSPKAPPPRPTVQRDPEKKPAKAPNKKRPTNILNAG
jgi:hypothetical protein